MKSCILIRLDTVLMMLTKKSAFLCF